VLPYADVLTPSHTTYAQGDVLLFYVA
jgi:hypothetical protein